MTILDGIEGLAKPVEAISDLYTTDKARIAAETEYQQVVNQPVLAQLANNGIMASAPSVWENGWQPALGWSCSVLVLLYYAPQIIIATILWTMDCFNDGSVSEFPLKPDDILNLVFLIFGMGFHSLAKIMK